MGFFMCEKERRITAFAIEQASDVLKRRWPNRYIGRPMVSIDDCISGLIEMGAMKEELVDLSTKRIALVHWMLSRIEYKEKDKSYSDTSFYRSSSWRKLRFSVIAERESKCCACGATPKDGISLHVDHIKPRSKYPELALDPNNLQILCEDCNLGKSDGESISFE